MLNRNLIIISTTLLMALTACNKKSDDATTTGTTYSAEKPSTIMSSISSAIVATGDGMSSASGASVQGGEVRTLLAEANCDSHGQPISSINNSLGTYPGTLTYCKIKINDGSPDTVQGGFALVKNISCALENAGITFDGQARSATLTIDSTCFTAKQITDMGGSMTVTITASKPAAFNTYFDAGIELTVPSFGTFKIASKVSGTKMEFATFEDQGTDKKGATYGSLDQADGTLRYEARMERLNCSTSGSCGWNRHIKIYADLAMSGTTPTGIESISFGYSNIQSTPGQSGFGGELVTAKGDLNSGIKSRFWAATNGSGGAPTAASQYSSVGNWVETTNTNCYTKTSDTATTCGTGAAGFTSNVNFLLYGSSYTAVATWFTNFNGATNTSVDVSAD